MPVDEGTRGTQPALKPKPKPHPVLQEKFNFHGSPEEFWRRVERIDKSHTEALGYRPSGALAYDIAKSPVKDEQVPVLFQVPRTKKAAAVRQYVIPRTGEDVSRGDIGKTATGLQPAEQALYLGSNVEVEAERFGSMTGPEQRRFVASLASEPPERRAQILAKAKQTTLGIPAPEDPLGLSAKIAGAAVGGLVDFYSVLPLGIAGITLAEYRAGRKAIEQRSADPIKDENVKLAKEAAAGFKQHAKAYASLAPGGAEADWKYISENIGFIAWDFLGAGSLVKATRGRVKATKAAPKGKKKQAAVYGAAPETQTLTSPAGQIKVEALVSEGPLAPVQKGIRRVREEHARKKYVKSADAEAIPEAYTVKKGNPVGRTMHRWYGFERKIGRELDRLDAFDQILGNVAADNMRRISGWDQNFATKLRKLPDGAVRGLTRGETLALYIEIGVDEVGEWAARAKVLREHLESNIALGLGDETLHRIKLADMKMAEQAMKSPRPRFERALVAGREVSRETTALKKRLGLADEFADRRVYAATATMRGEVHSLEGAVKELRMLRANLRRHKAEDPAAPGDMAKIEERVAFLKKAIKDTPGTIKAARAQVEKWNKATPETAGRVKSREVKKIEGQIRMLQGLLAAKKTEGRADAVSKYPEQATRGKIAKLQAQLAELNRLSADDYLTVRVDRATDALEAAEEFVAKQKPRNPDTVYVPLVPLGKQQPPARIGLGTLRASPLGIGRRTVKMYFPELTDEFTGAVLWRGDWRADIGHLLADKQGAAVTRTAILERYNTLVREARAKPRSIHDTPILKPDVDVWPEELKQIYNSIEDAGQLTRQEMSTLTGEEFKRLSERFFPGKFKNGRWEFPHNVRTEDVLWIDKSYLSPHSYLSPAPNWFKRPFSAINAPFVFATLYSRVAYLLNMLGAGTNATFFQGPFLVIKNTHEAVSLRHSDPDTYGAFSSLVGAGRTIAATDRPFVGRAMKKGAQVANAVTDQDFRIGTLIYYLKKHGVSDDEMGAFVKKARDGDPDAKRILYDSKLRANKAGGEIDNLSFIESEAFRELAFIYTWRRAMLLWALRSPMERPATAAVMGQIGQAELDNLERIFDKAEGWFKTAGFMPFEFDKNGNPVVLNMNTYNNASDLGAALRGAPFVSQRDAGPFLGIVIGGLTGRDEFGNEYPNQSTGGRWSNAALEALGALPYVSQSLRDSKESKLPPIDVTDRKTLIARLNAGLEQTVLSPAWLDGYGATITGGFTERTVNMNAQTARWYTYDATPEERRLLEKELIDRATALQEKFLGRKLPAAARNALDLWFDKDKDFRAYVVERGSDTTPADRAMFEIGWLKGRGVISEAEAAAETKQLARLKEESEIGDFRGELYEKYVDPTGALRDWDYSVRRVNALATPAVVNERLKRLTESGVNDAATVTRLSRQQLREYGLKADKYAKEVARREEEIARIQVEEPDLLAAAKAEYVAWKSEQDKPIVIDGVKLPSPARMEWASDWNYEKRAENIAKKVSKPWASMTRFEKDLLGKKVDPAIARGWQQLEELKAEYVAAQDLGERRVPPDFEIQAARFINRTHEGFYKDFLYAQEPLGNRLQSMRPILTSPHRAEWQKLFVEVRPAIQAFKNGAPKAHLRDSWKDYVSRALTFSPGFQAELDRMGIDPAEDLF